MDGEVLKRVVDLVRGCERELVVCCYEWGWYEGQRGGTVQDIGRAVCQAAQRGVRVRVLLHNEARGRPLARINGRTRGRLMRAGVEVRMGNSRRVLHAKFWLADGRVWLIGSHNMSTRATTTNAEVSVVGEGGGVAARLAAYFEALWAGAPTPAGADCPVPVET